MGWIWMASEQSEARVLQSLSLGGVMPSFTVTSAVVLCVTGVGQETL